MKEEKGEQTVTKLVAHCRPLIFWWVKQQCIWVLFLVSYTINYSSVRLDSSLDFIVHISKVYIYNTVV